MLRKIYYWLPPAIRLMARKIVYFPVDLLKGNPNIPPKSLIYTGGGDFVRTGKEWMQFFIKRANLEKEHQVLDIGSGIGRIALPLSDFLTGQYFGFEAMKVGVDWCVENITSKHPHFQFKYVPLYNDLYNITGLDASEYKFDYPSGSFDFACAISVFTHMIPSELENYLEQTALVLKPGAYLVATFFILDIESLELMNKHNSSFTFKHSYGSYSLMSNKVKSANVAYERNYLQNLLARIGFEVSYEIKGSWCGREKIEYVGFQDVLVMKKK